MKTIEIYGNLSVLSMHTTKNVFSALSKLEKGSYSITDALHYRVLIYPQSMSEQEAVKLIDDINLKISGYSLEQIKNEDYKLQVI